MRFHSTIDQSISHTGRLRTCLSVTLALSLVVSVFLAQRDEVCWAQEGASSVTSVIDDAQARMVKIYGAGGFQGLEAYQSGMLISETGHILTVFSYVLDTDEITVTLPDGRRVTAELLGADPRLEVAVLKVDATGVPFFDLSATVRLDMGERILAISNAYGVAAGNEPVSVQHGVVAVTTTLDARRGVFESAYDGSVYVLDVTTNNQGAAGGALIRRSDGRLAAMLGKELRNARNNTWLNYAVPIDQLVESVDAIRDGSFSPIPPEDQYRPDRALDLEQLGIRLVPNVLPRTPPYVDQIRLGSTAAGADIRPDDLIVLVGDRLVQSCEGLLAQLQTRDLEDEISIGIIRAGKLVEITLQHTVKPDGE